MARIMFLGLRSGPRCTPPLEPGCPTSCPFGRRTGGTAISPPFGTGGGTSRSLALARLEHLRRRRDSHRRVGPHLGPPIRSPWHPHSIRLLGALIMAGGCLCARRRPAIRAGQLRGRVPVTAAATGSLRWMVMGGEPSEDAGSAREAPRERPLSPVAEAQQWRIERSVATRQWRLKRKISPYRKSKSRW